MTEAWRIVFSVELGDPNPHRFNKITVNELHESIQVAPPKKSAIPLALYLTEQTEGDNNTYAFSYVSRTRLLNEGFCL